MMWVLKKYDDGEQGVFYFLPNREYSIGRKDSTIILQNDNSISRKHAVIDIKQVGRKEPATVMLTDFSKYGTLVNGIRIKSPTKLKENDEIHFGQSHNKFRFTRVPFIVAASCLSDKEKKTELMRNISHIGGEFVNEWKKHCTHLIMESLTFTIKAVCALACACPVVTSKYFDDLVKCEDPVKLASIQPSGYFPDIAEPSLKNLGHLFIPNAKRRIIFLKKKFVFLSKKQFKRLSPAIEMAGGIIQLQDSPDESLKQECSSNDVLILAPEAKDEAAASHEQKQWIQLMMMKLNECDVRAIKESEVGLAILHLSLTDYCNPRSSSDNSVAGTTSSQIMQETVADWASQWQGTTKTKLESKTMNTQFKKPADVLVGDTQGDAEKKRKRSAETSMYVTDTVPVDTTLPFHLAKRSKKRSSTESENEKGSFKESPGNDSKLKEDTSESVSRSEKPEEAKNSRQKTMKDSAANQTENDCKKDNEKSRKTDEGLTREKEEIEDIAKSILDDDDFGIEEDLFALDTEVTKKKTRTTYNEQQRNEGSVRGTDKSRISESQFTESVTTEKTAASDANFGHGQRTKDTIRVSDCQFVDTVGNSKKASIDTDLLNVGTMSVEKSHVMEIPYTEITDRGTILSTYDGSMEMGTRDATKTLQGKQGVNRYTDKEVKISGVFNKLHDSEKSVKLPEKTKDGKSGWLGVTQKSMASESQVSKVVVQKNKKRGTEIIGETKRDKSNEEEMAVEDVFADSKDIEKQFVSDAEVTVLPLGFKNAKINKPKVEVKKEMDPDIPDASTIVRFSALVKKKVSVVPKNIMYSPSVKNFKKFSKASFPGKDRMIPKVIGGRDLVAYETDNQEKDQEFAEFRAVNEQQQREERYIDDLFKMEANNTSAKRRKR